MSKNEMTAEGLRERAERLQEIREEIATLATEALELVDGTDEEARAKAYWFAQVTMALDDQHGYLGSGSHTIEDAQRALEALAEEAEAEETAEEELELEAAAEAEDNGPTEADLDAFNGGFRSECETDGSEPHDAERAAVDGNEGRGTGPDRYPELGE